ncbi:aminotransferase class V-fold PLP-dependent enzyme [Candidatus Similichlamydia epinepheli]|uniref:aminotransferase class V-fold PLP-dependent enzyme n=1 Tax=Candidatus Similichlamydia epinepheli TaxID=1903953 RepID=UPI000D3D1569|nr:aminotransferase class V-fold PLP-dependent enzyme [Candidatus Similichlamydia epinepheli]
MAYFDHTLSTFVHSSVIKEIDRVSTSDYSSPLSDHARGQSLISEMESSCQDILSLLGARPEQWSLFLFPSHAEAISQVFWSTYLEISRYSGRNQFLVSRFSEPVLDLFMRKICDLGAHVTRIDPNCDTGTIDVDSFEKHQTLKTSLLSLTWAHGQIGLIQPIEDLAIRCKEKGILLHVDGSHIAGKLPIQLNEQTIDFFTLNGEQIHGPKGSGLLLVRKPIRLEPLVLHSKKGSLFSYPWLLAGLGKAAKEAIKNRLEWNMELSRLRHRFEKQLQEMAPSCRVLFTDRKRLPHSSLVLFPKVHGELLSYELNQKGVYVSHSEVLPKFLKTQSLLQREAPGSAYSALSFSFAKGQNQSEIEESCQIIAETFSQLVPTC